MPTTRVLQLVLVLVTWCAGLVLLWGFPVLPFQDLVAHAGLIALRARIAESPLEASVLVHWPQLGSYTLFRALGGAFAACCGPLAAVRALATLVWAAYPAALLWARWRTFGDWSTAAAYAGMLLALGLMTLLGFASYQLAAALVLVANAEWSRWLHTPRSARAGFGCAALGVLLVLAHAYAFAVFVALASVAWWLTPRRTARVWAALTPALGLLAYSVWSAFFVLAPGAAVLPFDTRVRFGSVLEKLELLVSPTLMTRFGLDAGVSLLLWALAFAQVLRGRRQGGARRILAWQATLLVLSFALLPHAVGAFGLIDARLLPTALALALLGIDVQHRSVERGAAAATLLVLACDLTASARFQSEAVGSARVLSQLPVGARLLHLPLDPDSDVFAAHPFLHHDKLALLERPLIVSDIWFHPGTALYPTRTHPALRLPTSYPYAVLERAHWAEYHWKDWDYVLVRTRPSSTEPTGVPAILVRIDHVGGFWLYRVEKPE